MTDRRAVWVAVAATGAGVGGSALAAGIIARLPFVWIVGLIVLAAAVLGFTSLLIGWPMPSLSKPDAPLLATLSDSVEDFPAYMIPTYKSEEQEMRRLGPYRWLPGFGPRDPDLTLRAMLALPAVSASD